jgi:Arc/MetJ family transcription regulator
MTKKLDDFFNISSVETEDVSEDTPIRTKEELFQEARQIYSSLTTAEKVDVALPTVVGLDTHDREMDDIADKAIKTFEDLISLGGNVPDMHAGKIYEVAGQMLKTALEAKNAKTERKLKMIDLQLKKVRAEQIDIDQGNGSRKDSSSGEFDRNELLKYIINSDKKDK